MQPQLQALGVYRVKSDEYEDNHYSEDKQERGVRRPQMRLFGKADKPPAWRGSNVKRWQEFTVSLQVWHVANKDFMSEAQAIHKVYQITSTLLALVIQLF